MMPGRDPQELLEELGRQARVEQIVEAATRAVCATWGVDLDNLAAHAECGDTDTDVAMWRHQLLEMGRVAYEAIAPPVQAWTRAKVAQELLAAGRDPYRNLAWMWPEQAAAIARDGDLPPAKTGDGGMP